MWVIDNPAGWDDLVFLLRGGEYPEKGSGEQNMNGRIEEIIKTATGATGITRQEVIQSLWSGYGEIVRYALRGTERNTAVVKHVKLPRPGRHPRGWNTENSHERKLKSYEVETAWYRNWSERCDETSRIPRCLALETEQDEILMVLEDLDDSGYPDRKSSLTREEIITCLDWLANFHASFLGEKPEGLWETGTYWHLETRPDELRALKDRPLRDAAKALDQKLKDSPYQTIVHGDAKSANFCFSNDGKKVAAVDFQYVGGGVGMKDVAYFVGSCLGEDECERLEAELLGDYFAALRSALSVKRPAVDAEALIADWSALYHIAWTDFHRFLKGWSPDHWKIHDYSERIAREVTAKLQYEIT